MKKEKAIVVFSGGQDSTTCLLWALKEFEEVETVTFHYNQRHSQEIEVAKSIAEKLGVKNHLLDMSLLNQLAPNALTRNDIEIEVKDGELPSTFVPAIWYSYPLRLSWLTKLARATLLQEFARQTSAVILTAVTNS